MSQIVTTPIRKVKSGITTAVDNPTKFLISLGVGFGLGIIADLLLEYLARNHIKELAGDTLDKRIALPFDFWVLTELGEGWKNSLSYDDAILLVITIFMLFTKKFVTTFGFFLGWYISSSYDLYSTFNIEKPIDYTP